MNVEQTLTDELETVARSVEIPPPPAVDALVHEADTTRSRTRIRVATTSLLAAAAVVVAVVAGAQLGHPGAAPSPAPQPTVLPTGLPTGLPTALPTGSPPAISFLKDDKLYVKGQVQPGSWVGGVLNRGAASVGYLDDATTLTQTIALFHDGSEVVRVPNASVQGPVLSPTGRKAAWVERDGSTWYLVVYDLQSRREQGRLAVDAKVMGHVGPESEAWDSLGSVDDQGKVSWGGVLAQHAWRPGSAVKDSAPEVPEGTSSTTYPVDPALVSVSPDGVWGAWTVDHTGEQEQGASKAPDQYTVEVAAQKPGQPESRIEFRLPRNTNAGGVEWETTRTFLVDVFDDPTGVAWHYIRCSVVDSHCEYAPTPGDN